MRTNFLLCSIAAFTLFFSSCKKDVIHEEDSLTGESVSSESTVNNTVETSAPVYTSVVANVNSNVAGFWQAVPALYNQTTKNYPLIIFIHGIGELGTSLSKMNCCGITNHLQNKTFPANFKVGNNNFSFLVMAPQFKKRPSAAEVQSVIDYSKKRFRVDASRIYVIGLSMGGGSTWDWAAVYGQQAAAIVPVCGGTAPNTSLGQQLASKNLPSWSIYSTKDAVVPSSWGTTFYNLITQNNPSIKPKTKLTIYTDVNHDHTWMRAFNPNSRVDGYNIYEWLLQHTRSGAVSNPPTNPPPTTPPPSNSGNKPPIAKAGDDRSVPSSWNWFPNLNANFSTDSDGWIAKFQWTQISGPNTVKLANPNTGNTAVTGWTVGTYTFRVAVHDNKGAISYDDVSITITGTSTTPTNPSSPPPSTNPVAGNKAPLAKAGDDRSVPKSWNWFPNLNANFSTDSDGWIAKFQWTQIGGPNTVKLANPNTGNTAVTGWTVGTYTFRVAVHDNKGAISYDDVKITITNN